MHSNKIRTYLFYLGILLTIIGLPYSRAFLSIGQVVFGVLFLFDLKLLEKLKRLSRDRELLSFISIYFILFVTLLYSEDKLFGLNDLRTKIPILLFPLVFATEPQLSARAFRNFTLLFATTVSSAISYSWLLYLTQNLADYREAFPFVSHIRLSIQVLIAMSIYLYYGMKKEEVFPKWLRIILLFLPVYLLFAMISLELLTGVVILALSFGVLTLRFVFKAKHSVAMYTSLGLVLLVLLGSFGLYRIVDEYTAVEHVDVHALEETTALGNKYSHKADPYEVENGHYIGLYIQWEELQESWNQRSSLDFDTLDRREQQLKFTLVRYLNSLGLRKDAQGVLLLSDKDILNVENGIANAEYANKFSLKKRVYKLLWEYQMYRKGGESAHGHSLIQRLELWQTALTIIKENPVLGVGVGDNANAFQQKFEKNASSLMGSNLRGHNQYLTMMVNVGVLGFLCFVFSMFYAPGITRLWKEPLFFYFFCFITISMLWEDTLDTQVGATIYGFFFAFYFFSHFRSKTKAFKEIE